MRSVITSLMIVLINLAVCDPAFAGRGCQAFHDLSQSEYMGDPRLRNLIGKSCKHGVCSEEDAEEILSEMRKERKSGKSHFKGSDALHRENEQVISIVTDLKLTREQRRQLHDEITGQHLSREEILMRARDLFDKSSH